jgi:ATP-dependent Clp protease protease subunit
MAKINKDYVDHLFEYGVDIDNRTIYLGSAEYVDGEESGVDWKMAERFIKAIHLLETAGANGDKPINIILSTGGGDTIYGLSIYDAISACKNHVTITVYGQACSMGAYILQSADTRLLAKNSVVMFHEGQDGYNTNHPEIIRRWVKFNEKYGYRLDDILMNRIREKHPEFKEKKFKEMNVFDTILTAADAVELGLADAILGET